MFLRLSKMIFTAKNTTYVGKKFGIHNKQESRLVRHEEERNLSTKF